MAGSAQEIKPLTSLRGIAACLVVVLHLKKEFGGAIDLDGGTHFFDKGYLWVDFFFILSGFIIAHVYLRSFLGRPSPLSWARFLIKRLGRVYPLHFVTLLAFVGTEAAKLFVSTTANPPFSVNNWGAFLANLLLVQAWGMFDHPTWNQPAWSISAEWLAYLAFPLLVVLVVRLRSTFECVVAAGVLVLGLVGVLIAGRLGTLNLLTGLAVFRCLFEFGLGMLIYRIQHVMARTQLAVVGGDLSLALALLLSIGLMHFGAYDVATVCAFVWVVASASVNAGVVGKLLSGPFLHFLGVISYSIYLVQGLIVRAWQMAFQVVWHGHMTTVEAALVFASLLAIVVAASTVSYYWIEVPGRRYFTRLADKIRVSRGGEVPVAADD